jgi:hypothetical protein
VHMGEVPDLVDEHRTAGTACRRPPLDAGGEHEVVEDELAAALEQVEEALGTVRPLEDVVLVDPDHRQPAALGGQRVPRPGGLLLLHEQPFAGNQPVGR